VVSDYQKRAVFGKIFFAAYFQAAQNGNEQATDAPAKGAGQPATGIMDREWRSRFFNHSDRFLGLRIPHPEYQPGRSGLTIITDYLAASLKVANHWQTIRET
jgi:hypothetical protein